MEQSLVTKQELALTHSKMIVNSENNNAHEKEIVKIFGGIDDILKVYLKPENDFLDNKQINELYRLLTISSKYKPKNESDRNGNIFSAKDDSTLTLLVKDTFLNIIFGEEMGMKLNEFILSSIVICTLFIFWFFGQIINIVLPTKPNYILLKNWYWIMFHPIVILWLILSLMSVNRRAANIMAKTFEFYFKMCYAALGNIAFTAYYFVLLKKDKFHTTEGIIQTVLGGIVAILLIALISLTDGLQYNKFRKLLIGIISFIALFWAYWSIVHEYFSFNVDGTDPSLIEISHNIKFSLLRIISGSARIISIFLFKQAFSMYYKMKKEEYNKSVFIKISPNLKWITTSNEQYMMPLLSNRGTNLLQEIKMEEMKIQISKLIQFRFRMCCLIIASARIGRGIEIVY
eukprot:222808_1